MRNKRKTTESFIKEAETRHSSFYSYSKTVYKGCMEPVIITCPLHGDFIQKPYLHLSNRGCKQCGNMKTNLSCTEDFIVKANKKHSGFYTYDKVDYKSAKEFVIITCPIHGDFSQRPNYHLSGNGCTSCYKENNGFGRTNFLHSCRKSNLGRLYVIRCFSEDEEFIKIGITSKTIKERFKRVDRFPYKFEILYQEEGIPEKIFDLEKQIHRDLKEFKYQPKILFRGHTECFSIKIKDYDFRRNEKSS